MNNISLRPKNILVIGGGSGIGYAVAQKLLDNGANNIVIASRSLEKLTEASRTFKLNSNQQVYPLAFDITKVKTHKDVITKAQEILGENLLDGLVISAGVNFDGSNWKGFNVSEEDWDKVMNTNLKGVFFFMREFSNYLYENKILRGYVNWIQGKKIII